MIQKIKIFLAKFKRSTICLFKWIFKTILDIFYFVTDFIIFLVRAEAIAPLIAIICFCVLIFLIDSCKAEKDNMILSVEQNLKEQKYEYIDVRTSKGDYISGELLARKRMDDIYGNGKYIFVSTNFNNKVWYKIKMK